jgi:hypothetical protein
VSAARAVVAMLAGAVAGCASGAPVRPVTFGAPDAWGPGLVDASSSSARLTLADSAYVILMRVYPGAGVDTYFPDGAQTGRLPAGTHALAAPVRTQRRSSRQQVDLGTDATNEQNCRQQTRAFYEQRATSRAGLERTIEYICSRSNKRTVGAVYDEVRDGYLLLIVSDVPTPGGPLRESLQWMVIEPDSIGAALPVLAEVLVGTRTNRWAAYSLAPRRQDGAPSRDP